MSTLDITKNLLNKYNIRASKRFGQNFLTDDVILESITDVSQISKEDIVIEIGPGLGNLTEYLLKVSGHVLCVEIDEKMIEILKDRLLKYDNYTLINADILKLDLDKEIDKIEERNNCKYKKVKVVANLPYYITTPILFKLLEDESKIDEIVVMVQKEVAERMVAKPNTKEYGILTLMVEYLSDAQIKLIVPSESFIPSPNVTSAVIKLNKNKKYKVSSEKVLFDLIHLGFAKRRKKMVNSLFMSKFMNMSKESIEKLFTACNFGQNTRAEELSLEDYIKIEEEIVK